MPDRGEANRAVDDGLLDKTDRHVFHGHLRATYDLGSSHPKPAHAGRDYAPGSPDRRHCCGGNPVPHSMAKNLRFAPTHEIFRHPCRDFALVENETQHFLFVTNGQRWVSPSDCAR